MARLESDTDMWGLLPVKKLNDNARVAGSTNCKLVPGLKYDSKQACIYRDLVDLQCTRHVCNLHRVSQLTLSFILLFIRSPKMSGKEARGCVGSPLSPWGSPSRFDTKHAHALLLHTWLLGLVCLVNLLRYARTHGLGHQLDIMHKSLFDTRRGT